MTRREALKAVGLRDYVIHDTLYVIGRIVDVIIWIPRLLLWAFERIGELNMYLPDKVQLVPKKLHKRCMEKLSVAREGGDAG